MKIPGPVEPGLVIETRHVDDKRIPRPSGRPSRHPSIEGTGRRIVHVDRAAGAAYS